jgi:rsbT antagonist protein RsbS
MPVPILKQGNMLIASIQSELRDKDLLDFGNEIVAKVGRFRSRGVVVDVSALDVLDSYAARTLRNVSEVTKLRGATMVIVGIQPYVAFSMVELGLTLEGVHTALDLEEGLDLLIASMKT